MKKALTFALLGGDRRQVRLATLLVSTPSWLIYDIYSGSLSGIVCEALLLCSVVISVLRFGWKALDVTETAES